MNVAWKKIMLLLKRELFQFRSARILLVFGIFGLVQALMMFAARAHGLMEDTMFLFFIGGLCTLITAFDLVARERETHVIDLLLTQGISRGSVFFVKWIVSLILSVLGAFIFCAATVIGTGAAGQPVLWSNVLPEFGMVTWLMATYAVIALLCSVLFRNGKSALIAATSIWVVFRPPVVSLLLIHPIQSALNLDKTATWKFVAFLPDFAFRIALDIEKATPADVTIPISWPIMALCVYFLVCSIAAWIVFLRQDEPVL